MTPTTDINKEKDRILIDILIHPHNSWVYILEGISTYIFLMSYAG